MLIELEGIDGAGKTEQCRRLKEGLEALGQKVVLVKEPGWGTTFGERVRDVIMSDAGRDYSAEMFAFLACKAQLYAEVVIPSMAQGKIVISDRGSGSFLAYNNIVAGVEIDELLVLHAVATFHRKPSITILLDAPYDIAHERKKRQGEPLTRFDRMSPAFFRRQQQVFIDLATRLPQWVVVDARQTIEQVRDEIITTHLPYIQQKP